jgi:hypothetical protein
MNMSRDKIDFGTPHVDWRLNVLLYGLIAGLISSLCISSTILLTEKLIGVPVGTFYLVITDALLKSSSTSITFVLYGLILHLITGSLLGLVMAIPFLPTRKFFFKLTKYSQLYGAVGGLVIWFIFFVPTSLLVVLPETSQISMVVSQKTPTGLISSIDIKNLKSTFWEIIILALPFNIFYGLVTGIVLNSMNERYIRSLTPINTKIMK